MNAHDVIAQYGDKLLLPLVYDQSTSGFRFVWSVVASRVCNSPETLCQLLIDLVAASRETDTAKTCFRIVCADTTPAHMCMSDWTRVVAATVDAGAPHLLAALAHQTFRRMRDTVLDLAGSTRTRVLETEPLHDDKSSLVVNLDRIPAVKRALGHHKTVFSDPDVPVSRRVRKRSAVVDTGDDDTDGGGGNADASSTESDDDEAGYVVYSPTWSSSSLPQPKPPSIWEYPFRVPDMS